MARHFWNKLISLLCSRGFRRGGACVAVLIVLVWLTFNKSEDDEPPPLVEFPIERIGEEQSPELAKRLSRARDSLAIFEVSKDGRWAVFGAGTTSYRGSSGSEQKMAITGLFSLFSSNPAGTWLFDVEKRRFVAKLPQPLKSNDGVEPPQPWEWWNPERMVVSQDRERKTVTDGLWDLILPGDGWAHHDSYFYELDVPTHKARFLFKHRDPGVTYARLNQNRTHLAYEVESPFRSTYYIRNLASGASRALKRSDFEAADVFSTALWGWSPDGNTLVITEGTTTFQGMGWVTRAYPVAALYLVDALEDTPPRRVSVNNAFQKARLEGRLNAGEIDLVHSEVLAFVDDGKRCRLLATFGSSQTVLNPRANKSSIWDLDLTTGKITRVVNLMWGIKPGVRVICSPSGETMVAVPAQSKTTRGAPSIEGLPAGAHTVGQRPKPLPFNVFGRQYGLLDDHTLIYVSYEDDLLTVPELRRFDLRTSESEVIFPPRSEKPVGGEEQEGGAPSVPVRRRGRVDLYE